MKAAPLVLAALAAAAVGAAGAQGAPPSLDDARLGPDGLGPVRIGMTTAQAREATSSRLTIAQRNGTCAVLAQAGRYDGVYFILTSGVVRRATVESIESVNVFVTTLRGLRLASSEKRVRELYGRPFFAARDANSGGLEMVYRPRPKAAPARRYVFVTASIGSAIPGRYVSEMSVGDLPEARYQEACS